MTKDLLTRVLRGSGALVLSAGMVGMTAEIQEETTWVPVVCWYLGCLFLIGVGYLLLLVTKQDDSSLL